MKKIAILSVLILASTACAYMEEDTSSMAETKEGVTSLISTATEENKKAAKMGGLWRDANKMIKKAKDALEKGDLKKAMKLAKTALEQGKLGQMQAEEQKNAAPWLF